MKGTLYGVGVGPGDPELITRKAERIIREADVVAVPDRGSGGQTAREIAAHLLEGKELLTCTTPMVRDRTVVEAAYDKAADNICALLEQGKTVAMLTLGDPTVYSTYLYIHRRVESRGYHAEIVPGVTSFCAAAARLGRGLCEGAERLLIVPASHQVEDCLDVDANLVFMKAGRDLPELQNKLKKRDLLRHAALVSNCGMAGEQACPDLSREQPDGGYYSVVLVKRGSEGK